MEKKTKTSHRMYMAWDYDREIKDLDKASGEGWQLTKGGCFSSSYEYDPDVIYRYQLDFNPDKGDRTRYLETFAEQGWEYINSTYNGWHYFRKPYDAALPDSEYEIYTDRSMMPDLIARWIGLARALTAVMVLLTIMSVVRWVRMPQIITAVEVIMCLDVTVMLAWGAGSIMSVQNGTGKRMPAWAVRVFLGIYLICMAAIIIL